MFQRGRVAVQNGPFNLEKMLVDAVSQYTTKMIAAGLRVSNNDVIIRLSINNVAPTVISKNPHYAIEFGSEFLSQAVNQFFIDNGVIHLRSQGGDVAITLVENSQLAALTYKQQHDFLFNLSQRIRNGEVDGEMMTRLRMANEQVANLPRPGGR